jgi:predicted acyltransferase
MSQITLPPSAISPNAITAPLEVAPPAVAAVPAAKTGARSLALDVLRGLTVALMLVVNNTVGSPHPQFMHADWGNGITVADLVFPWFLFCSGAAIPLARRADGWVWKAVKRAFWLFALGCLVVSIVAKAPIFSLGVLQLIALAGLVAALLQPLPWRWRIGIALALLVSYWAFILLTPVANVGVGVFDEDQNAVRQVNSFLEPLGLRGLPSVVPTAALVMIGALVTELIRASSTVKDRVLRLSAVGGALTALGWLWNFSLEFNKPTWTPSYVVFSCGLATLLLAAFSALEGQRWFKTLSAPLVIFGSNALLFYILPIIVKISIFQTWQLGGSSLQSVAITRLEEYSPVWGDTFYTALYVALWWCAAWIAYRNRWFFKV